MNIGYYAHHHGSGHCRQADKLARLYNDSHKDSISDKEDGNTDETLNKNDALIKNRLLNKISEMTVFTSVTAQDYTFNALPDEDVIRLPTEHETVGQVLPGRTNKYWQPECLHYSPVGNSDIQKRSAQILSQVLARQIELMIVDLSVEVALLCRTASVPYLYVRLPGRRDDTPHLNAFAGAIGLLAFYPKVLESDSTPQWVKDKTLYLGFAPQDMATVGQSSVSREMLFNQVLPAHQPKTNATPRPLVTIIKGFGGHQTIDEALPQLLPYIRQHLPEAYIISLGPITDDAKNLVDWSGQVADVQPYLAHSTLLVMACGLNAIGEACQYDTPLIVMPDSRPHDEHLMMAQALVECGRAMGLDDVIQLSEQINQQNTLTDNKDSFFKPIDTALKRSLQVNKQFDFAQSLVDAANVKDWFEHWLLPQLSVVPS